jgi:hypothetical protein
MNFDQNLFISFTHIDNQPLTDGDKGWITRFHATLKTLLSMRMGREAKIWRDDKLQGNDVFSDEIIEQLKRSAALVSIVSSRYLQSEWCTREARLFCENAKQSGGLAVGSKSRVFKVIKTPVDTQEPLPPPMKEVLGYEFFTLKDGAPLEFDSAYGQEYAQLYNQKVAVLAWQVKELLEALAGSEPQASGKPAVYLAECGYDRKRARELLDGELKRLGYTVLPDRQLPADEAEYIDAVKGLLARCALSIHLVGETYGAVPDGPTTKSASMHQNELAAACCRSGSLKRLIWLPHGTRSQQPLQQAFIEALAQDAQTQFGADLIAGDIEELRAAIHATLKKIEEPEPPQPERDESPAAAEAAGRKLIYLICDEKDRKAAIPLRKLCAQSGFDVALPAFEGDAAAIRKTNQQLLASCDAVVLFYGAGDEAWKRAIDNELRKLGGYRGGKPLPARCTYLAAPKTGDKEDLIEMAEAEHDPIDGLAGLAETSVTRFLKTVTPADGTTS